MKVPDKSPKNNVLCSWRLIEKKQNYCRISPAISPGSPFAGETRGRKNQLETIAEIKTGNCMSAILSRIF